MIILCFLKNSQKPVVYKKQQQQKFNTDFFINIKCYLELNNASSDCHSKCKDLCENEKFQSVNYTLYKSAFETNKDKLEQKKCLRNVEYLTAQLDYLLNPSLSNRSPGLGR